MSVESETGSLIPNDPYALLRQYKQEANILSKAYGASESYYRQMYKTFTYPLVVLTTISTVFSGFDIHQYAVVGLNLCTLLLLGFNTAIDPKDKEHQAHQVSGEFSEIQSGITQFIRENSKSRAECRQYSQIVVEQMTIWRSLSPPIRQKYLDDAQKKYGKRVRKTNPEIQKNESKNHLSNMVVNV
jgi:hypothetical protein